MDHLDNLEIELELRAILEQSVGRLHQEIKELGERSKGDPVKMEAALQRLHLMMALEDAKALAIEERTGIPAKDGDDLTDADRERAIEIVLTCHRDEAEEQN